MQQEMKECNNTGKTLSVGVGGEGRERNERTPPPQKKKQKWVWWGKGGEAFIPQVLSSF